MYNINLLSCGPSLGAQIILLPGLLGLIVKEDMMELRRAWHWHESVSFYS